MSSRQLLLGLARWSHGLVFLLMTAFLSVQGAAPLRRSGPTRQHAPSAVGDNTTPAPMWSPDRGLEWRNATTSTLCEVDASEVEGDDERSGVLHAWAPSRRRGRLGFHLAARMFARPEATACTGLGLVSFALARGPPNDVG